MVKKVENSQTKARLIKQKRFAILKGLFFREKWE